MTKDELMTEEQIKEASIHYDDTFCTGGIRDAFEAGVEWADKTMLKEVLEWLDENFYESTNDLSVQSHFDFKDRMFQSFKERFNIE